MATNNKIPKCPPLRFPNFNDEWKETTLGEIAEIKKGSGLSKEDLTESGQPVILYGELYTTYTKEVIETIYSKTNVNCEKLVVTNGGEVIIPSSGETAWDIATARCVIPSNVILGGDLNIITLKKDNGAFFSYLLNGVRKRAIAEIAQGSSVVHLYGKDIIKLSVSLPSLAEQKKIADFLSLIDERIQSCSETIKERKREKAGLLNQLFSQKLRFPDFNDEWTTSAISEVCKVSTGSMNTQDKVEGGEYPFYIRSSTIERTNRYTYDGIAILTPGDGAIGKIFHYSEGKIAVHQRVYILSEITIDTKYLFYYFSDKFYNRVIRMSAKNTVDSVRMNMITDMPISLPSLKEQKKIADFLSLVDERIEVEEQLLKKYEEQKKYLLRQMFV